jgi:hypothetical protein
LDHPFDKVFNDLGGRHDDQGAKRSAANRDEFGRLDQRMYLPAGHHEAAEDAAGHNDASDYDDHEKCPVRLDAAPAEAGSINLRQRLAGSARELAKYAHCGGCAGAATPTPAQQLESLSACDEAPRQHATSRRQTLARCND